MQRNLIINAGSSTIKMTLFRGEKKVKEWLYEKRGPRSFYRSSAKGKVKKITKVVFNNPLKDAIGKSTRIDQIGFRYVHGGYEFHSPTKVTAAVLKKLKKADQFAPLHNPVARKLVEQSQKIFPKIPKTLFFDTAFHAGIPEKSWRYAIPKNLTDKQHLRRYGFHGLVYSSILSQLKRSIPRNLIICHLGSGCSVAAIKKGRSIDTTMGLTPLEGLIMTTRAGDLDPGLLIHLLKSKQQTLSQLEETLSHESGLIALSGTRDMREVIEAAKNDEDAKLALEMFCQKAAQEIARCAVSLGAVDEIIFSGGIGENAPLVRSKICTALKPLGIRMNARRNRRAGATESFQKRFSRIRLSWYHADEAAEMNRQLGF